MNKPENLPDLLQSSDKSFTDELYKYAKPMEFEKGSSPFYSDDLLKHFYIVVNGRVKTYDINFHNNKEQTIIVYKRGDMFDVISLLDGKPHEINYEVLEDLQVLQLPIEKVRYWLEHDTTFNKKFFLYLATIMRQTEELATELTLYDTKERLIKLLIDNLNPSKPFRYNLLHNMSNSEIAKLLGTVRHVVERTLKQLKADELIETSRRKIQIKNLQKFLEKSSHLLPD
jgi:CRP-like cAMP-binding protein